MRLIDADKLKVYLQEYLHYGHAIPWVDAQPTAYDVEKVVAELEELKKINSEAYFSLVHLADKARHIGAENAFEDAIDIVKAGRING